MKQELGIKYVEVLWLLFVIGTIQWTVGNDRRYMRWSRRDIHRQGTIRATQFGDRYPHHPGGSLDRCVLFGDALQLCISKHGK